jgi:type I restriction enzyme M protein
MRPGDWESVFGRLEELVLANSGEDEFQEIFKLLIAKLFDEMHGGEEGASFAIGSTSRATAESVNSLLSRVSDDWPAILEGPPRTRLSDEHVSVCVEALQGYSLLDTNVEVLDGVFEYLVSKASKGAKGQYFTPRHVIDCCVRILAPQPGERIADPACGSGGFLVHALTYEREHSPNGVVQADGRNLWGFDFDRRSIQVAKALMLVAGARESNLFRVNSLLTPQATVSLLGSADLDPTEPRLTIEDVLRTRTRGHVGFDIILTNPPFAGEIREGHILETYELARRQRSIERDVLFLERCVDLLRPGGRLAIVLPHNKFASQSWSYAREWLLKRMQVVAVLGLGRNTFMPHTSQKTSVLVGVKRSKVLRSVPDEEILFLISEKDGKDSRGRVIERSGTNAEDPSWIRTDHDLDALVTLFREFAVRIGLGWGVS